MNLHVTAPLSVPRAEPVPRPLTPEEQDSLLRAADVLVPRTATAPSATDEPRFLDMLAVALDARSDAFDALVTVLGRLSSVPSADLFTALEEMAHQDPAGFQALSTVIAGAWLLTPGVQDRIGYHGPRVDRARIEEAADELETGILDAVLDLDHSTRWVR